MIERLIFCFKQKTAYDVLRSLVGSEMCIRDSGKTVCPVREAMIAGNIYDLLRQVTAVSRESVEIADIRLPYVQFDGCSVTGKQ